VNEELGRSWKEAMVAQSGYNVGIFVDGLGNTMRAGVQAQIQSKQLPSTSVEGCSCINLMGNVHWQCSRLMEVSTIIFSLCTGLNIYGKKRVNVQNITPSEDKIRKFPHEKTDRTVNKNAGRIAGKKGRR
jgi:hypothetical protein